MVNKGKVKRNGRKSITGGKNVPSIKVRYLQIISYLAGLGVGHFIGLDVNSIMYGCAIGALMVIIADVVR